MKIIQLIQEKFWILPVIASALGLLFPTDNKTLGMFIIPLVMILFFFTCLKIDFLEIISHIKKPLLLLYILTMYLLLIPALMFGIFHFINPEIAIGILLLAAISPGASAPVLSDIFKGNAALSLTVSLIANLIAPFTLFILLFLFTQKIILIDLGNLFQTLLLINFLPLILAQIIRKMNKQFIEKTKHYYSSVNIFCIGLVIYIVIAIQAKQILENIFSTFIDVLWLYVLFIFLFICGYFVGFWKKKSDKIALAVTKTYMNNALLTGIAITFFSPKIALFMVLSEIPWSTTLGIFKYLLKYLK